MLDRHLDEGKLDMAHSLKGILVAQFLVASPHTVEECAKVIKLTLAMGYLTHFRWGCPFGEHCGWAIIEADNEKEALLSVPALLRPKSRVTQIVQFDPAEVDKWG